MIVDRLCAFLAILSMTSACGGDEAGAGGASGTGGSGGAGNPCASTHAGGGAPSASYPPGPYGTEVSDVMANLVFIGETCDGVSLDRYVDAPEPVLVLWGTAGWCDVCRAAMPAFADRLAERPGQATVLGVLYEDTSFEPADAAALAKYVAAENPPFPMVADPDDQLAAYVDQVGAPRMLVLARKEMTIEYAIVGYDEEALLAVVDGL